MSELRTSNIPTDIPEKQEKGKGRSSKIFTENNVIELNDDLNMNENNVRQNSVSTDTQEKNKANNVINVIR